MRRWRGIQHRPDALRWTRARPVDAPPEVMEVAMPTYVTFFRYTSEAWKRMVATPENRAVATRSLIERVGGRMEAFYWMFGEWDGVVVYHVDDTATAAPFCGLATSSRRSERVKPNQLVTMDEAHSALQQANSRQTAYVPPGGQGEWLAEYDVLG